jgi:hypothetical protein
MTKKSERSDDAENRLRVPQGAAISESPLSVFRQCEEKIRGPLHLMVEGDSEIAPP